LYSYQTLYLFAWQHQHLSVALVGHRWTSPRYTRALSSSAVTDHVSTDKVDY
jgi:hypothetical protein